MSTDQPVSHPSDVPRARSVKSTFLTPAVAEYLATQSPAVDDVLAELADYTAGLGSISGMQIAPDQGALLTMLTRLVAPRFAVEVGTFTGYSSICIARGLADGGRLLCCDLSEEWTSVARTYWERAGVVDRIELRLAPALETLQLLPGDPQIDLAFIDADKTGYRSYWDEIVPRLRPGGLLLVDNVLWSGRLADPANREVDTIALREFNDYVRTDARVEAVLVPIADGLTLARRR
ncbi:MAG: O-methyltransferase [Sporichthyaceae bacterium]